jgi:hypothetical protein
VRFFLPPAFYTYVRLANIRTDTYTGYFITRALDAPLPLLQYVPRGICLAVRRASCLCLRCVVLFLSSFRGVEVASALCRAFAPLTSFRVVEILLGSFAFVRDVVGEMGSAFASSVGR